ELEAEAVHLGTDAVTLERPLQDPELDRWMLEVIPRHRDQQHRAHARTPARLPRTHVRQRPHGDVRRSERRRLRALQCSLLTRRQRDVHPALDLLLGLQIAQRFLAELERLLRRLLLRLLRHARLLSWVPAILAGSARYCQGTHGSSGDAGGNAVGAP